ncbi:MAG: response regulator transcription factor [Thermoleophilia bacterium]|nr:response regulator transcription factor [Thermoleophilia bacterium]
MGLGALLCQHASLEVAGEAATAAEAVEKSISLQPDVVLMDVRLPDESGVEACRKIRSALPETKVLMLTSYSDDEAIFSAIMAGASGYLLKVIEAEKLCQAVEAVARGESLLDPTLSLAVIERVREIFEGHPRGRIDSLNPREKEILKLIADGMTNKEIARDVRLTEKTVRNYVSGIFKKLDVTHRTQAAIYYLERKATGDG